MTKLFQARWSPEQADKQGRREGLQDTAEGPELQDRFKVLMGRRSGFAKRLWPQCSVPTQPVYPVGVRDSLERAKSPRKPKPSCISCPGRGKLRPKCLGPRTVIQVTPLQWHQSRKHGSSLLCLVTWTEQQKPTVHCPPQGSQALSVACSDLPGQHLVGGREVPRGLKRWGRAAGHCCC